jgi:hypothetical protein
MLHRQVTSAAIESFRHHPPESRQYRTVGCEDIRLAYDNRDTTTWMLSIQDQRSVSM